MQQGTSDSQRQLEKNSPPRSVILVGLCSTVLSTCEQKLQDFQVRDFKNWEDTVNYLKLLPAWQYPTLLIGEIKSEDQLNFYLDEFSGKTKRLIDVVLVLNEVNDVIATKMMKAQVRDYFCLPVNNNEFICKVKHYTNNPSYGPLGMVSDFKNGLALNGQKIEGITLKEWQILSLFEDSLGMVISKEESLNSVWKGTNVSSKTVDVHIHNIRKKIKPLGLSIQGLSSGGWKLKYLE